MSEKKLFVVENDYGKYWDFSRNPGWWSSKISYPTTTIYKKRAEQVSDEHGGHVVTLVEEPEKVVLSKEQAQIVDDAHDSKLPACHIASKSYDEELLMRAYVNGYTVAKDKRYKVRVPETQTSYYYKGSDGHVHASDTSGGLDNEFSDYELQQYGLDGERFTKEEVTDDEV
ncbi:DUF1642 domain-containing protein [Lacticaseibacillus paracasei]|uniref:DUF1642 domain-containing protein n=1 Tax=Lacticaseibacillus paracasei TaxID=1597 RepID=UPI0021AFC93A|nr:DUF1642 domain-containing protein [Lacticaseibacillus paracasei]UWY24035.1 DUF1642 domain-containing protein [Lacticaseibacillus paracasei]